MKNVFHLNTNIPYNFRSRSELYCRYLKTVKYETETISFLALEIWSLVSEAIKSTKSLDGFKSKLTQWKPDCSCCLCKSYLQLAVFISFFITYFFKSTINIMYSIRFKPMHLSYLKFFVFLQLM